MRNICDDRSSVISLFDKRDSGFEFRKHGAWGKLIVSHIFLSIKPQSVAFEPKRVRSLVLKDLIQAEGTSPFPALTQIEAFGTEVK